MLVRPLIDVLWVMKPIAEKRSSLAAAGTSRENIPFSSVIVAALVFTAMTFTNGTVVPSLEVVTVPEMVVWLLATAHSKSISPK